jgi:tRNA A37 threonylcarbamoyladenosine synthetase subunit TsaC/SUA5/YrdC
VNAAKGRPPGQAVGLSLDRVDRVAPFLDLDEESLALAEWLCDTAGVSLFVPARPDPPEWLSPAVADGVAFFTATPWLPGPDRLLAEVGAVYMSSANITSTAPALTADTAAAAFGATLLVLDGDPWRDPDRRHGSTSILRLDGQGQLAVARTGINDLGEEPTAYVDRLRRAWDRRLTGSGRASPPGD